MKHLITKLITVSASVLLLSGCNEFLDTTPTDRVSDRLVWTDAKYTDLYINNFYCYLNRYGIFGGAQFSGNMTEGLTNTMKYGSVPPGSKAGDSNNYVFYPEQMSINGNLLGIWDDAYVRIRRINEFLDSQKKYSQYSAEQNALYEAQAKFFRAYVYFQLAKRHGSLILYDNIDFVKDKARSTEAETWQFIADYLDFAAKVLPRKWDAANSGRLTRYAAFALKSRAMLYAERWEDAKSAADSVINSGLYALAADYSDAWKGGNSESILEFRYDKTNKLAHTFDKDYVPYGDFKPFGSDEYGGSGCPTQEMVEEYEDRYGQPVDWSAWHTGEPVTARPPYEDLEPRFAKTILYNGSVWKGNVMENTPDGDHGRYMGYRKDDYARGRTVTGYYLRKLLDENNNRFIDMGSDQTYVEIRYAEVLLNRAEALMRTGKLGEAMNDVNQVRARVGLPQRSAESEKAVFENIRHERMVELSYEGFLYWDMRRWELAHVEYDNYRVHGLKPEMNGSEMTYTYVDADLTDRKFMKKSYVLPMPASETNNNSLAEQYDEWK